jgi:hypothetical protein
MSDLTERLRWRKEYDAANEIDRMTTELAAAKAVIEKAEDALQKVGCAHAWRSFGECRSFGEGVPLLDSPIVDMCAKETLAAIENWKEKQK